MASAVFIEAGASVDTIVVLSGLDEKRLRVLRAIDRSIDDMPVEELCERVGISRRTFYRLFESKYQIWQWYSSLGERLFLDKIGLTMGWREAFLHHFRFLNQERTHQYWAVGSREFDRIDVRAKFEKRRSTLLQTVCDHGHQLDQTLRFTIDIFVWTEIAVVYEWCRSDNPLSPEELTDCLLGFVPKILFDATTSKA